MFKIEQLIKMGWYVDISRSDDGWYNVGATHTTIGDVEAIAECLAAAVDDCLRQAKELSKRGDVPV